MGAHWGHILAYVGVCPWRMLACGGVDGMQCSGVEWNGVGGMQCSGVEWNGVDGMECSGVECPRTSFLFSDNPTISIFRKWLFLFFLRGAFENGLKKMSCHKKKKMKHRF